VETPSYSALQPCDVHWILFSLALGFTKPYRGEMAESMKDRKLRGMIRTGSRGEEYFFHGLIGMLFFVAVV